MQYIYLIIGFIGLLFVVHKVFDIYINKPRLKVRRDKFCSRKIFEIDQWYNEYYRSLQLNYKATVEIVKLLASALKCHITQIYPADSFSRDMSVNLISMVGIDEDDELIGFEADIMDLIGHKVFEREIQGDLPDTVGDFIAFLTPYVPSCKQTSDSD